MSYINWKEWPGSKVTKIAWASKTIQRNLCAEDCIMLWKMQLFIFISMLQKHTDRGSYVGTHRIKRDKFTTKDMQNLLKLWCYFYRKKMWRKWSQYNHFELKYINLVCCVLFSVMLSVNHVYVTMKYLAALPFNHPRKSLHCCIETCIWVAFIKLVMWNIILWLLGIFLSNDSIVHMLYRHSCMTYLDRNSEIY